MGKIIIFPSNRTMGICVEGVLRRARELAEQRQPTASGRQKLRNRLESSHPKDSKG